MFEPTDADIEAASAAVEAFVAAYANRHNFTAAHPDVREAAIALLAQACEVASDDE